MKWLLKIKEVASLITAATVVIGVLFGVFKFMDRTTTTHEALAEIKVQQETVLDSIASLSRQVSDLTLEVEGVKDNMMLMGNAYDGLKNSYIMYVKNNTSATEKFLEYMSPILDYVKKNNFPTVVIQPGMNQ